MLGIWRKQGADDAAQTWAHFASRTIADYKHLILVPNDAKSTAFGRSIEELANEVEALKSHQLDRHGYEVEAVVDRFAKYQRQAIEDLIGQLDQSLRDLVSTLDNALDSGDEMAEAAKRASRSLRYLDEVDNLDTLKSAVQHEMSKLIRSVQHHAAVSNEIHARYQTEIETMREHLEDAQKVARTDHLTKLPNRTAHEFYLHAAIAKAKDGNPFSLALLDLDGFKAINDQYGHEVGDSALITFSVQLREAVGKEGFVCRLAGDEFTVVYRGNAEELQKRLDAFQKRLNASPLELGDSQEVLSASFGIADVTGNLAYTAVMKDIDERMYLAKRSAKMYKKAS